MLQGKLSLSFRPQANCIRQKYHFVSKYGIGRSNLFLCIKIVVLDGKREMQFLLNVHDCFTSLTYTRTQGQILAHLYIHYACVCVFMCVCACVCVSTRYMLCT